MSNAARIAGSGGPSPRTATAVMFALALLVWTSPALAQQPTVELAPRQGPLIADGTTAQRLRLRFSTKDVSRQIRVTVEGARVLGIDWPFPRVVEVVLVPEAVSEPRTTTVEVLAYLGSIRLAKRLQVVLLPPSTVPPPPEPAARASRPERQRPVARAESKSAQTPANRTPPAPTESVDAPPTAAPSPGMTATAASESNDADEAQAGTPSAEATTLAAAPADASPKASEDMPAAEDIPPQESELNAEIDLTPPDTESPIWSVGLKAGVLANFGAIIAPVVQVDASARIPRLAGLRVGVDVSGTFVQLRQGHTAAGAPIDVTLWTVPLMGRLAYRFELGQSFRLTLSAGGGVVLVGTTLSSEGQQPSDRLDAVPGFGGMVAFAYVLGPGALALEVGYHRAVMSGDIIGNVSGLTVSGGYAFDL